MKKIALIVTILFSSFSLLHADGVKEEALTSLDTAKTLINQGNYSKAVEEINYALSKLNEIAADGLLKFIPEAPAGFKLDKKDAQGVGQAAAVIGTAGASATYLGPKDSSLELNIAIGGMAGKMASMAALGTMYAGLSKEAGMTSVRINGYTGTQQFDKAGKSGNLTLQVGEKASVTIHGNNIDSPDAMKALAQKIDLAGLEKAN